MYAMEERELVNKIKELRRIKPDKDWVVFTKGRILGEEKRAGFISTLEVFPRFIFKYNKFAFATVIVFGLIAGAFTISQNSLPGDPAFVLKKALERTRAAFASQQDLPKIQLELANKRLEELDKIAKTNQSDKLAPAIQEFQNNVSKAAREIASTENPDIKQIVSESRKIKENTQQIEALGVVVGRTDDLDSALLELIQREINDLQVRTLTEDQQKIFLEAVDDFSIGDYASVLEKIWSLSNQQN